MHVNAGNPEARKFSRAAIDLARPHPCDAELVFLLARRNLVMRLRVDIRIDAQRDRGHLARRDRTGRKKFQLRLGFDVETMDTRREREIHLSRRLADAGKQDLLRRNAGGQRAPQLALGHHVGARPQFGQRLQHGLVRIGLHRVAHQCVDIGESIGEDLVVPRQRRG